MRVLVFGGTGIVGRAVVRLARRRGLAALGLAHEEADVTDAGALVGAARSFRPDLVVNCAARTKVDACESRRDEAFATNGAAVANVLAAAAETGARVVHFSTDYVFDGALDRPYREEDVPNPLSVYGASKLEGERRALADPRALVLRTSWVFGDGGSNFVASIVARIEQGKLPLRVVSDQTGCPTYGPFLARAALDLGQSGVAGLVHYRNREPVSWFDFAREIARRWRRGTEVAPIATADYPLPARRPARSVLDVARFESLAGREVEPWSTGLDAYLDTLARRD